MKLLYISTVDHIIHVMLPHLDAARARGWQVDIACHVTRDPAISQAHCDTLYEVPLSRNPFHPSNLLAVWKLIKLIRKEKYDIVHCHNPSGGVYGRLAATLSGIKPLRVYTAHGFHFHPLGGRITNTLFRAIETFAGRFLSDAVLTINQWDYEQAQKMMPPERVYKTAGVGVSTDKFDPSAISEETGLALREQLCQGHALAITTIGEFIPRKRHMDALGSFVLSEVDGGMNLLGEGQLQQEVLDKATNYGWTENHSIQFLGYRRDVEAVLAATDILIFPSVQEGLPCSVQEALAMEVPVVAYDIRGCDDMVDDTCGRLVPFGDIAAMADAVRELASLSPEQRKEMGKAGRKKMVEQYERKKCIEAWLKIYDDLMSEKPLPHPSPKGKGLPETPPPSLGEGAGGRGIQ